MQDAAPIMNMNETAYSFQAYCCYYCTTTSVVATAAAADNILNADDLINCQSAWEKQQGKLKVGNVKGAIYNARKIFTLQKRKFQKLIQEDAVQL